MKELAPFFQTALWFMLIIYVLLKYHKNIKSLLESIQKRIDEGGGIKTGLFELPAMLKPQSPALQKVKAKEAKEEMQEEIQSVEVEGTGISADASVSPVTVLTGDIKRQYFLAEDLALRAIQIEFGVPIGRQMRAGNLALDGYFALGGKVCIIEVKYANKHYPSLRIQQTVHKIFERISRYGWRNVKLILVVVYGDNTIDLNKEKKNIMDALTQFEDKVDVRCYSLDQLSEEFGLSQ